MLKTCLTVMIAAASLSAQWAKVTDKSVPRTADGKPNLTAAMPKKADGKPNLEGVWLAPGPKFLQDITAEMKEPLPIQQWALDLTNERKTGKYGHEESDANCLPQGVPKISATPLPFKIIQNEASITILHEAFNQFRQIHLDGRELPQDPNPTWLGYSVGKWEGDTLVVTSAGFNGKTWLDQAGHPTTEALRVIERYRRLNVGKLEIQITVDDAKAYTKPWTVTETMNLLPDTDLIEMVCLENERDMVHLKK